MPDLEDEAIGRWLEQHGSAAIGAEPREPWLLDDDPDVLPRVFRIGEALDEAKDGDAAGLAALLASDNPAARLSTILLHISPGRRVRVLHWLSEPSLEGGPAIVAALLGHERKGPGATLRQWILDMHRRDLLASLFAEERIDQLLRACAATNEREPSW
jgi:hypothetical protein